LVLVTILYFSQKYRLKKLYFINFFIPEYDVLGLLRQRIAVSKLADLRVNFLTKLANTFTSTKPAEIPAPPFFITACWGVVFF
jgi:hypothetical protein